EACPPAPPPTAPPAACPPPGPGPPGHRPPGHPPAMHPAPPPGAVGEEVGPNCPLPGEHAVEEHLVLFVQSPRDLGDVHVRGAERLERMLHRRLRLPLIAARIDVERDVAHLRPRVDREMGL